MGRHLTLQVWTVVAALSAAAPAAAAPLPPWSLSLANLDDHGATLAWEHPDTASVASFQIRLADSSGAYRTMTDWNGRQAAYSFACDDGRRDDLAWAAVCAARGVAGTFFCVPDFFGDPGFLTSAEVLRLDSLGMEIGCHSMTHARLMKDEAFHLRYVGSAEACSLRIWGGYLLTYLGPDSLDLSIDLNGLGTSFVYAVAEWIDALPDYECTLDFYHCANEVCRANYLEWVRGTRIGHDWYQTYTTKGVDSLELETEVAGAKEFLEAFIARPGYTCRSFAYPYDIHDQREMAAVVRAGYLDARDGILSARPWGSPDGPDDIARVNLFEKMSAFHDSPNGMSETTTRIWIRAKIDEWKAGRMWATLRNAHTYADIDSSHFSWILDEVIADGGVWIAPIGDVAEYVRSYAVNVGKPPWMEAYLAGLEPGRTYYATVTALDHDGNESDWSNEITFALSPSTGVREIVASREPARPLRFVGTTPAPGRSGALLWFSLLDASTVSIDIYNLEGREVGRIGPGSFPAGLQSRFWSGLSSSGRPLASGRYCAVLRAGAQTETGRLLLVH
jgi:hypothetical protein